MIPVQGLKDSVYPWSTHCLGCRVLVLLADRARCQGSPEEAQGSVEGGANYRSVPELPGRTFLLFSWERCHFDVCSPSVYAVFLGCSKEPYTLNPSLTFFISVILRRNKIVHGVLPVPFLHPLR